MAKLLDFMVSCSAATPDDAAEDLLRMADPDTFDSREEMANHFEDCLGYNPMEYFDRKSVEDQFEELVKIAPFSVQEQLRSKRVDIINRTVSSVGDLADAMIHKVFLAAVKESVGWNPIEPDAVSIDDCISMAIFGDEDDGELLIEDEDDSLEEDLEEEYDASDDDDE